MAAQNPNTKATIAQRNGQGNALRTAMRGALMVRRRRKSRNRTEMVPLETKKPPKRCQGGFSAIL
jgi:hypothetical protein